MTIYGEPVIGKVVYMYAIEAVVYGGMRLHMGRAATSLAKGLLSIEAAILDECRGKR